MEIILSRHGKTNENQNKHLSGNSNVAQLNNEGVKHSKRLVKLLSKEKIDKIISSPLDRAINTAKPISKALNLKIEKENLLREFDFGSLDGKNEQGESLQGLINRRNNLYYKFPNGESYKDVLKRVEKFLKSFLNKKLKQVLLVSHAGINRAILTLLLGLDENKIDIINSPNDIIYFYNTKNKSLKWINTKNNTKGKGILFRKKI